MMSSKSEQINLRISSDLKNQLTRVADKLGMSMSDYIRKTLEDSIDKDTVEKRISLIESKLNTSDEKEFRKISLAGATIASIDTGLPLDQCLSTSLGIMRDLNFSFPDLFELSKTEMEYNYLKIQDNIKNNLGLSDLAIAFISLSNATFVGMRYDSPIFDVTPLSIKTLERLRNVLES